MKTRLRVAWRKQLGLEATEYWPVSGERAWLQEEQREEEPLRRGRPLGGFSLCSPNSQGSQRQGCELPAKGPSARLAGTEKRADFSLDMPVGFAMPVVTAITLDSRYKNMT